MDPMPPVAEPQSVDEIAQAWYVRLISGEVRKGEVARLEQWLAANPEHDAAFRRVRAIYGSVVADPLAAPRRLDTRRKRGRALVWSGAASAAAVLLLTMPSLSWMLADHATRTGEIKRFDLPDGTVAYLDTNSALDVDYDAKVRRVSLRTGRAWFKVARGNVPFRVDAAGSQITDIGTAFSVALPADGGLDVAVEEGVVDVRVDGLDHRLTKGAEGRFVPGSEPRQGMVRTDAFRWREGWLSFDGRPLGEVLDQIGRYRSGYIYVTDSLTAGRRVSATLSVDSLDSGLAGLAKSQHLRLRHVTPWLILVSPVDE